MKDYEDYELYLMIMGLRKSVSIIIKTYLRRSERKVQKFYTSIHMATENLKGKQNIDIKGFLNSKNY